MDDKFKWDSEKQNTEEIIIDPIDYTDNDDDFGIPISKNNDNNIYSNSHPAQPQTIRQQQPPKVPPENISSNSKGARSKKKKKSPIKKLLIAFVAVILVFAVITASGYAYVYSLMNGINYNPSGHKENVYVDESELAMSDDVTNILLIGVDRRVSDALSRSDAMLMLSIDKANKKIKQTSFLRDLWVDIPDSGYARLNSACYTKEGAQRVMDTIEYNFNVKINHYMLVDFEIFKKIIDKIGGIDIDVTEKEAKYIKQKAKITVPSGDNVHLNGEEALWYSRIRKLDSDFMRTERQRKVINSIIKKVKQTKIFDLADLTKEILPMIETDLKPKDMTSLAIGAVFSFLRYETEDMRIPIKDSWQYGTKKGASVLVANLDKNNTALKEFLYAADTEEQSTNNESTTSK